jgi:hypothetical protein
MKLAPNEIPGLGRKRQPEPDHHGDMLKAIMALTEELAKQRETVVNVTPDIRVNVPSLKVELPEPKPTEWVFTVERDSRGLIQTIKATNG